MPVVLHTFTVRGTVLTVPGPSSARRIKKIIKHYEYSPGTLTRARLEKSYKQSLSNH